tara:strand:- start:213 stop:323 length:111 start_codon:yes stop_codon:yes gene_type:complete
MNRTLKGRRNPAIFPYRDQGEKKKKKKKKKKEKEEK